MIPVKEYTSEADMRAGHIATRVRLLGTTQTLKRSPQPANEPIKAPRLVYVRHWTVNQDSHVTAWRLWSYQERIKSLEMSLRNRETAIERMIGDNEEDFLPRISATDVCKAILSESAAKGLGNYSMQEIFGPRRDRRIVEVRHLCIAAVVQQCPHLSYPQIGRFFNRDHSSIYNAAKKHGAVR
jgi:chromosomal replication initiation ATPase DnaA